MNELTESINCIVEELEILTKPNSWGQTIGDELHQIEYQLSRIADALGKLAKK